MKKYIAHVSRALADDNSSIPNGLHDICLAADVDARIAELEKALRASSIALDDWLNTYASEMCREERVAEAYARIDEQGGTLHYIAVLQEENRKLMDGCSNE